MIDPGLDGKNVLVTGANNPVGVGAATARAFAQQNAAVYLTYLRVANYPGDVNEDSERPGRGLYARQQMAPIEPVLDAIRAGGGRTDSMEADLSAAQSIAAIFDCAEAAFGPVDVLVNSAAHCLHDTFMPRSVPDEGGMTRGGSRPQPLDAPAFDQHFAVNTRAVALMMTEYTKRFVARGASSGRIVNVSTDGADNFPGGISYGASKHAMESYSRSAAVELGRLGITVNVVSLGVVQTGWVTDEMARSTAADYPLRRMGNSEDVASAIIFLASEQASWITGQLLYVGGGHAMPR